MLAAWLALAQVAQAAVPTPVPPDQRGRIDQERQGTHDAANIRTAFWNYGMSGDYPANPGNVDLSVFHSAEAPKGSGMNYSDGVTPFVLARIIDQNGEVQYIMETGYRERQAESPLNNRIMRFEPRPGYFNPDPSVNRARSPAISNDPRTWPAAWPDKLDDTFDPGWASSWNGYFGKRPAADQESYTVMDDDFYDAWRFEPDSRDPTRKGLGLRVEVRGFQWANPQAGNVIFWHYDITNESTTHYVDNVIFGLYMDSGVGGSALSCDGIFESDDDNAFFDKSSGLNLVYTWDSYGHGRDLSGNCARTGYLGYAYLETPGNAINAADDDGDGVTDEKRDAGPGTHLIGQDAIRAYVVANYNLAKFQAFYGPLESRPAYRVGNWWTGDEDMDWIAEASDFGQDGVRETGDPGEGDGEPTFGEPNFDRTDLNESDQIGLTGFKMNRIAAGVGNPDRTTDGVLFYMNDLRWPQRLFDKFTDPNPAARFDSALASNYNIGFLFASGPFTLQAQKTERFSLAMAFGGDLPELRENVKTVQQIYNANYQFAVPPSLPVVTAEAGDRRVRLSWSDNAERSIDPVTGEFDFEGYRIYRATDPEFRDPRVITTGRGTGPIGNGRPIAQFDLVDGRRGFSTKTVDGVAYWLGEETGIVHTWTDTTVTNGQQYYYAVCAYDYGSPPSVPDSLKFYPSENSIAVSRTARGGVILPPNVVSVRPNPRVPGWQPATVGSLAHVTGIGRGGVDVRVTNSNDVRADHLYALTFTSPSADSLRATRYVLRDSTDHRTVYATGADFDSLGVGPVGDGLLVALRTPTAVVIDSASTGYVAGSPTNTRLKSSYQPGRSVNYRRPGYPNGISIVFDDVVRDTGLILPPVNQARPAKFLVVAHTPQGDLPLDFRFRDNDLDGTLSRADEFIDILTYRTAPPTAFDVTWRVQLDTLGQGARGPIVPPRAGDTYRLAVKLPFTAEDVFTFRTTGAGVNPSLARSQFAQDPYVVPNPYVGAASFEPERFATSGRGDRRVEFRNIPTGATIRVYTLRGTLVRTLKQDGSQEGFVPWDLRTKDNLDLAAGLYLYHVDAPGLGTHTGKFSVIK